MNWTAKLMKHRNESRIAVYFDRNADLIERIKQIKGARWSQKMQYGTFLIQLKTEHALN